MAIGSVNGSSRFNAYNAVNTSVAPPPSAAPQTEASSPTKSFQARYAADTFGDAPDNLNSIQGPSQQWSPPNSIQGPSQQWSPPSSIQGPSQQWSPPATNPDSGQPWAPPTTNPNSGIPDAPAVPNLAPIGQPTSVQW